ncbi:MAG: SDR family NAD(P)-dependent oxidoreductase [Alphaproteobacteria bacterium]
MRMAEKGLALVIGGANGIGSACCEVMKREGWSILVADKDIESGKQSAARLGGQAFALDVSDKAAIEALEQQIDREIGPLEALVVSLRHLPGKPADRGNAARSVRRDHGGQRARRIPFQSCVRNRHGQARTRGDRKRVFDHRSYRYAVEYLWPPARPRSST